MRRLLSTRLFLQVVAQVGASLTYAHDRQVFHLDIKPSNIMVVDLPGDEVLAKIIDFGVAAVCALGTTAAAAQSWAGTPAYMAPEQAQGIAGPACDIYALAVLVYRFATGRLPFEQKNPKEMMIAKATGRPQPPSAVRSGVPPLLDAVLLAALDPDPALRPTRAADFAAQVLEAWSGDVPLPRPISAAELPPTSSVGVRASFDQVIEAGLLAIRDHDYRRAEKLLADSSTGEPQTARDKGRLALARGTLSYHLGDRAGALLELHQSLRLLGVADPVGVMAVSPIANILSEWGLLHSAAEAFGKLDSVARSLSSDRLRALAAGNLGRLYLQQGNADQAEAHFREDLELSRRIGDSRIVAQMMNHLGQVSLLRRIPVAALEWLDEAITLSARGGWISVEGFSRKDRALALLALGRIPEAREEAARARTTFERLDFREGLAHAALASGRVAIREGDLAQAENHLYKALNWAQENLDQRLVCLAALDLARLGRAAARSSALVTSDLLKALSSAEACREAPLIAEVEEELGREDPAALWERRFRRLGGGDASGTAWELLDVRQTEATVIYAEIRGGPSLASVWGEERSLSAFTEVVIEVDRTLQTSGAVVMSLQPDRMISLLRGSDHAARAVEAALAASQVAQSLATTMTLLDLPALDLGVGVASGPVVMGNFGSFRRLELTAIGEPIRTARALAAEADGGAPLVASSTSDRVRGHSMDHYWSERPLARTTPPLSAWEVRRDRSAG